MIRFGGKDVSEPYDSALYINAPDIPVRDTTTRSSENSGLRITTTSTLIESVLVRDNEGSGVWLESVRRG